ncbi:hypothetical protein S7711_03749 [Stachybotrys chartarum IBT 7711]|uniref:Rhomboid family membrane protein n=1 Tax=Stachybotrys chartarum (strain CBS 109288 / IBT 7711) TaxID=1280523 RepID=A0A084AWU1_STACB|nr:hypothetical protein S7711_03749 [Stachybotrys chartarum IBT 7711]KFA49417.1 hypothetical protein S40293_05779 [Stachybotrys chartarum IBT 40293]
MSQEQAQQPLPPRNPVIHNAAIVGTILCPIAMLLPPRRMDIRFFVLAGAFSLSTNQLAYAYTGQSIYSRFGQRTSSVFDVSLPEGAKRTQQLLKERREREAAHQQAQADQEKKGSLVKDIWMGGESEDWKQKREAEHKKSFEEGKGMSGIILEQIGEVWSGNWRGKPKASGEDQDGRETPEKKQ